MEKINITIGTDGAVDLQLAGFTGGKCKEATKTLERLLGNEIIERTLTSEFYQTEEIKQEENLSGS
jgi:Fe-S cluster biogenesis protein NfuA